LGVGIGAAVGSAANILKANSQRGTLAVGVAQDGTGGYDVDALAGLAVGALGLAIPNPMIGALLVGTGLGLGTGIVARESAVMAEDHQLKQEAIAVGNLQAGAQVTSGLSLEQGGPIDSLASFGGGEG
jgi:hypothetical protein